jgi:hypothetical protein
MLSAKSGNCCSAREDFIAGVLMDACRNNLMEVILPPWEDEK